MSRDTCLISGCYVAGLSRGKHETWADVGSMLGHRLRRCPSIKPTLTQCICTSDGADLSSRGDHVTGMTLTSATLPEVIQSVYDPVAHPGIRDSSRFCFFPVEKQTLLITHVDWLNPWPFKSSWCIKASFYIPENRLNFLTTKGFRTKISMKLDYQYVVIFFDFKTTSSHLHCSNSRLVVDEDGNGKSRIERVKALKYVQRVFKFENHHKCLR